MKKKLDTPLLVGFARVDITPSESLPMGGYIARTQPATGAHDPLYAKAIAFRYGDTAALLLVLDTLCVSSAWVRDLRGVINSKIGLPPENIMAAATHTHSGPAVLLPVTSDNAILRHEASLLSLCVDAAEQAYAAAEPSRVRLSRIAVENISANRRHSVSQFLVPMSVVRVEDLSENVKGHFVSFACHPTVMPAENLEYSADFFGAAAREVEATFPESMCAIFNGAAGDMSTRHTRRSQTWPELNRLGKELAKQIARASEASAPAKPGPVKARFVTMSVPFRKIPSLEEAQKEFEAAQDADDELLQRTLEKKDRDPLLLLKSLAEGRAAKFMLSKLGGWEPIFGMTSADVELSVIRIGDLIVCGLPCEFFEERGTELADAALSKFGFVVGYANGYWGYVAPPSEAALGGYEAIMSPLPPEYEPQIIREAKMLVREIKKASSSKKNPGK